jgi:hypothetical protein
MILKENKMINICAKCKFWQENIDIPGFGSCRYYAPRPLVEHPVESPSYADAIWPRTRIEDWCSMWEPEAQL